MSIQFDFLPHAGESILVKTNQFTMLIDGGCSYPFGEEYYNFNSSVPPYIDIVVITHIDQDHIKGIIELFYDERFLKNIKYIIFNEPVNSDLFSPKKNSNNISSAQGNMLAKIIKNYKAKHINLLYTESSNHSLNNIFGKTRVQLLSPNFEALKELPRVWKQEYESEVNNNVSAQVISTPSGSISELAKVKVSLDNSITNQSSLAFLMTHEEKNFLLLGDAHINQITTELRRIGYSEKKPLDADFIKLSHHGSIRNINEEFLSIVKTNKYIICKQYYGNKSLPNKETIAKILEYGRKSDANKETSFFITKDINKNLIFSDSEKSKYKFQIYGNYQRIVV